MKITLTLNEVLTLIAEGMTMNNVTSLANKLRNADAPVAASDSNLQRAQAKAGTWDAAYNDVIKQLEIAKQNLKSSNQQVYDYERALEKAKAQSKTWEQSYHDAMVHLDKAKQTEIKLRAELSKANDVIAEVKASYEHNTFKEDQVRMIRDAVEEYYRGN